MQSFGHINFNNNQAQQVAFQLETEFPVVPVVGRILFKDKRVFICAEISNGIPAWLPLTNEINTFVFKVAEADAAQVWTIPHNLDTLYPIIQLYDLNHSTIIPNSVHALDNNNTNVTFGWPFAGVAVAMYGDVTGVQRMQVPFVFTQASASTVWTINHDLGYYPVVRVFTGNQEILPTSIIHNTLFTVTLTFNNATAGIARLI